MFDAFSRAIDQANQRGEFLSTTQIDALIETSAKAKKRLNIINRVTRSATKIVTDVARALFVEQPSLIAPGGNAYTNRRMASCLRDMEFVLRYVTYAMLAGDSSVLDDRCLNGLREIYLTIGTPPASVGRAIQIMKEIVILVANQPEDETLALAGDRDRPTATQILIANEPRETILEDTSALLSELAGYFERAWTAVAVGFPPEEDIMTNSYFDYAQDSYLSYVRRLTEKRVATAEELAMYHLLSDGRVEIRTGDSVFLLEREDEQDSLDSDEKREADAIHPFWNASTNAPEKAGCPAQVDRRSHQTSIKHQNDRGTCVAFASLANLEAILKAQGSPDIDLSEHYAYWLFMNFEGRDQCDDALRATLAARYLSMQGVCEEPDCPYEDMITVQKHCTSEPSARAKSNAKYGIEQYALIDRLGSFGPSIANPDYLEAILCNGFDVVFGTHVVWGNPDSDGVYDVLLDKYGNPQRSGNNGHAMLIIGYNRGASLPYFICKNSWGTEVGIDGYFYLSYDYIRTYAKYGYIARKIRVDMPTASPVNP